MPLPHPTQPAYQVVDPATGELVESFPYATDAEVGEILATSRSAYLDWRDRALAERTDLIRRAGARLLDRAHELAETMRLEMGKPAAEGVEEIEYCASIFDYYVDEGRGLLADEELPTRGEGRAIVQHRPIGPLLGVMPWNYPCYQVARFVVPNLVLGNTVIIKHAESVPRTARALEQVMLDAGLPHGAYLNVFATHEQVETIIADPRVQGVSLTGSERAGSVVAAAAGRHLKKCVLELGGSDPFIVLDSADVPAMADLAWQTRIHNNGQACNSNKRMIVMDEIYDEFVAALVAKAEAVEDTAHPPLASRAAAEHLAAQVDDAIAKGARLLAGGVLAQDGSARYTPAVLVGVTEGMRAYHEELFGPVAVVYRVLHDDHAVELANSSAYGLGGAVFSTDPERARRVAERLEIGMANVNTPSGDGPELPFGGVKRSGFGRELGPAGMSEFVNKRLVYTAANPHA
ncbi:NAD-dependent succinate-semialdehyde dehydrogenase [Amycolatopsis taiwanensis]|uniref:NAD-dependent succinate-semialdehyde dehydrogenase n=1 Tax=Amycolatopsis taiwanensis TaxID=342230 RepID=UPI0004873F53|nr:NAD-dependent succinate-semialdehyde dehydrogenase [Amycolatopsis taiwanensis]